MFFVSIRTEVLETQASILTELLLLNCDIILGSAKEKKCSNYKKIEKVRLVPSYLG